ncbi:MAG: hypothetical protein A2Z83_06765 [Omnitrophica bacterium GWA2_52_8]|nr:MAG: hypothetical protein A2Z83_06765 [Omnitrophica bacterium GWA2_52_8]
MSPAYNPLIMVAKDSLQNQKNMRFCLTKAGFSHVRFVQNGESCLRALDAEIPAVIILDTILPDMDGFEICLEARKKKFKGKIIISTGHIDAVDAEKAKTSGADDYVVKTSDFSSFIESLKKIFGSLWR